MKETENYPRSILFRESMIFQLKLVADGFRDFALVPVSLIATAVGLIRGGAEQDREFRRVIELGKQTEKWINLFGQHEPIEDVGNAGSIDLLLSQAEEVVRQQAKEGGMTEKASQAIQRALDAAHEKARNAEVKLERNRKLDGGADSGKPG
ncbi:MAG: hypothetical protein ACI9H8_001452 [Lysobacterales bacterium]|jgi:hypothetical protein